MDVKHWIWDDIVNIESTLSMQRGSWMEDWDQPIIEQTLLITDTMIPEEELANLDLQTDNEKFFWFDRLTFTYQTEYEINYLVDECKSDSYQNGEVLSAAECPWEVMPYGHLVVTRANEWKAIAHRPTTGLPNSINAGSYNAYATLTIRDKVTKEVLQ